MDQTVIVSEPQHQAQWVLTASGRLKIDRAGVLFARIVQPNRESVIIRARALLVTGLTTDNLIPVSALSRCEHCRVNFKNGKTGGTIADITLFDLKGEPIQLQSAEVNGLYPVHISWRRRYVPSIDL